MKRQPWVIRMVSPSPIGEKIFLLSTLNGIVTVNFTSRNTTLSEKNKFFNNFRGSLYNIRKIS